MHRISLAISIVLLFSPFIFAIPVPLDNEQSRPPSRSTSVVPIGQDSRDSHGAHDTSDVLGTFSASGSDKNWEEQASDVYRGVLLRRQMWNVNAPTYQSYLTSKLGSISSKHYFSLQSCI